MSKAGFFLSGLVLALALWASPCAIALAATAPAQVQEQAAMPAAEVGATAPAEATHAEHEGEDTLPQFDTSKFPSQIFWLVISFVLTYGLMRYVAMPRVESTLALREAKVQADIAEAKLINDQAKALMAEYEGRLSKARHQAQEVYQQLGEENNRKATSSLADQQKALEGRLAEAENRILNAKAQAMAALDKEAESLVAELVARVAGVTPKPDAVAAAIRKVKAS